MSVIPINNIDSTESLVSYLENYKRHRKRKVSISTIKHLYANLENHTVNKTVREFTQKLRHGSQIHKVCEMEVCICYDDHFGNAQVAEYKVIMSVNKETKKSNLSIYSF